MNDFTFCNPTRVYFGHDGIARALDAEMPAMGDTVMIAYGGGSVMRTGTFDAVADRLRAAGKRVVAFGGVMPNPTYAKVQEGAELARREGVDFILALGGGSVVDCCKVVSAQARLDEDLWSLERDRGGSPTDLIPIGALVTVSGTGAEMNNGAVITHEDLQVKGPLWGAQPAFAVLDPDVMMTVPPAQVVSGAFDTLSHCMETYFGVPGEYNLSDSINEAIMRDVIRHLRTVAFDPHDYEARSELAWASAMAENSILKIGKVTDFQCHMIEHQLGALTDCNHGQGLAAIHPALYRHLAAANPAKFARFAVEVMGVDPQGRDEQEMALAGVDALASLIAEVGLPTTLTEMGITDEAVLRQVADTSVLTAGCCKRLDPDEILAILHESL